MYDKFGQVLRLENLPIGRRDFKVFRRREGDSDGPINTCDCARAWDLHRRAELGQKINERDAAALATVEKKHLRANWQRIWASGLPGKAVPCVRLIRCASRRQTPGSDQPW